MEIKILGSGCPNCIRLEAAVKKAVGELGLDNATVETVGDMKTILEYDVLSIPALAVDGKVKCCGRVPDAKELKKMLCSVQ
jgi:small redox-active disulfide protein 2